MERYGKRILFSAQQANEFPLWKGSRGSARYLSTSALYASTSTPAYCNMSAKHFSISDLERFGDGSLGSSLPVSSVTFSSSNYLALFFSSVALKNLSLNRGSSKVARTSGSLLSISTSPYLVFKEISISFFFIVLIP